MVELTTCDINFFSMEKSTLEKVHFDGQLHGLLSWILRVLDTVNYHMSTRHH